MAFRSSRRSGATCKHSLELWSHASCASRFGAHYPNLISQLLIDHIEQRLAFAVSLELLEEKLHRIVQPIGRMVGAMRRKQDIFQLIERMTFWQRLLVENVQRSAFDSAGRKSVDQGFFVD